MLLMRESRAAKIWILPDLGRFDSDPEVFEIVVITRGLEPSAAHLAITRDFQNCRGYTQQDLAPMVCFPCRGMDGSHDRIRELAIYCFVR